MEKKWKIADEQGNIVHENPSPTAAAMALTGLRLAAKQMKTGKTYTIVHPPAEEPAA